MTIPERTNGDGIPLPITADLGLQQSSFSVGELFRISPEEKTLGAKSQAFFCLVKPDRFDLYNPLPSLVADNRRGFIPAGVKLRDSGGPYRQYLQLAFRFLGQKSDAQELHDNGVIQLSIPVHTSTVDTCELTVYSDTGDFQEVPPTYNTGRLVITSWRMDNTSEPFHILINPNNDAYLADFQANASAFLFF